MVVLRNHLIGPGLIVIDYSGGALVSRMEFAMRYSSLAELLHLRRARALSLGSCTLRGSLYVMNWTSVDLGGGRA